MRMKLLLPLCLLAVAALPNPAQTGAAREPANPADKLLLQWANALGGKEKLASIRAVHTRFQLETGELTGTGETWNDAQGRSRQQVELGGTKELTVFDGKQGWTRDTVGKVRALEGKDLENAVTDAYLGSFSQFITGRMPGNVEYAGMEGPLAKLRIVPERGVPATVFIDTASGLPVREVRPSQERTLTTYLEEWKVVEGIKFPSRVRQGTGDPSYDVHVNVVETDVNAPIEAALFAKPEATGKDFQIAGDTASITLPIELNSNHIYVQARINDSKPLWCIFDSGAEGTVVNGDRMQALGLKAQGKLEGRGAGGKSINIGIIENARLEFSGATSSSATMSPRPIASAPLSPIEHREGREIDAIIGYDIISSFVVEIDYAGRKLTLHDPAKFAKARGQAIPFTFEGNLPIISAKVTVPGRAPMEGRFLVDTGARLGIELNSPFVQSHDVLSALPNAFAAPAGFGVGGATKDLVARLSDFQIGSTVLKQPIVFLSQDEKGSGADPDQAGLIGGDLLRRFTVTFDYAKQLMYLHPNEHSSEPFEYDMSGMALVAEGPNFRQFVVDRLIEKSPAAQAGIQVGDRLVQFQNKPAAELTLDQIRQALRQHPGAEVHLEVERQGKKLPILLKTRRLI